MIPIRAAEKYLESMEGQAGFGGNLLCFHSFLTFVYVHRAYFRTAEYVCSWFFCSRFVFTAVLLQAMGENVLPPHIRQQCAVTFKNYIKRNWEADDGGFGKICEADRTTIKNTIVDMMVRVPERIQAQLSEAIAIIGKHDFTSGKWDSLLPHLVAQFQSGDFHVINGVLRTAHPLFKRYRHEMKSDALWSEIKYVLDNLAVPLTQLFHGTLELVKAHKDRDSQRTLFGSLVLIVKLFYSLNCQEHPDIFADNMEKWFVPFFELLALPENPLLGADDEDAPGILEDLKTQILECVCMFALKYDDDFEKYYAKYVEVTWGLLVQTGLELRSDQMVAVAMKFLSSVARIPGRKELFAAPETLQAICEKVRATSTPLHG